MKPALLGWFDFATQKEATHNPSLDVGCAHCAKPMTDETVRTISISRLNGRSLFYRVHRKCDNESTGEQRDALDQEAFKAAESLPGVQ